MAVTFIIGNATRQRLVVYAGSIASALANEFAESGNRPARGGAGWLRPDPVSLSPYRSGRVEVYIDAPREELGGTLMATIELQMSANSQSSVARSSRNADEPYRSGAVDGDHGVWFVLAYLDPDGDDNRGFDGMSLALFTKMTPPPNDGRWSWLTPSPAAAC